ncbi:hypothetical protein [Actinokineospora sp. UTMC 2448]|uniref:hypothetical protein n=1 Tax=Actinokineospora sp. UTMC 2448 TaxID=2268449 RepID=UPI002164D382|nr:hypothetical protein [Actinokineospora sp. UTMC 2448]UVS82593.1 hypothetical protein Actkin_06367 [Actinokineospora sp. UTMC 2448]
MTSSLSDIRFEGFSNEQLAAEIDGLRGGQGAESLHRAVDALVDIAKALAETDMTLRRELAKIGVEWQGAASDQGHEETQKASIYAEDAVPKVAKSAGGVNQQGDTFSHTRNSAPGSDQLRGPTQLNGWDRFAGAFGHTTDNAQKVQETQAARNQAIGSLNDYQRGSQSALDNHVSLPVPPGMGLVTQPVDRHGMTSAQGFDGVQSSYTPIGGSGPVQGGTSTPFGPGPGEPGYNGANQPGGGGGNSQNPLPGRSAGIGPIPPTPNGLPANPGPGLARPVFPVGLIADASMVTGITGATAGGALAGASLPKDRVVRGATPGGPAGRAMGVAADVPDEQARAARAAERLGGGGAKSGSSLMSPAAATAPGEDDEEHVRKYGIDSDDVFGDDRLVIDKVLGGEDDD